MSIKTIATPFDSIPIDRVYVSPDDGNGFTLTDPGVYSLAATEEWFYAATDHLAVEDMTQVDGGEIVTFNCDGMSPVTRYVKTRLPRYTSIAVSYAQPGPDGAGLTQSQVDARVAIGVSAAEAYTDNSTDNAESYADGAIAAAIAAIPPAAGGDSTQFRQRAAAVSVDVAGFGDAIIDATLQVPCVAGTYLVEAEIMFYDAPYVPNIACDNLASGGQMAYAQSIGPDTAQLGNAPTNSDAVLKPICPSLTSWAGTGQGAAFSRSAGQGGIVRLVGTVVSVGIGTIGITHSNQLAPGNAVYVIGGSWLRVTKIA